MPHGTVVVLESEQYPFNHKRGYSVCETQNPGDTRTRVRQALIELRKSFEAARAGRLSNYRKKIKEAE